MRRVVQTLVWVVVVAMGGSSGSPIEASQRRGVVLAQEGVSQTVDRLVRLLESPRREERLQAKWDLLALGPGIRALLESLPSPQEYGPARDWEYILDHLVNEIETVTIPAGTFKVGSRLRQDQNPPREVTLPAFTIDRTEVTCFEYARYLRATGATAPGHWVGSQYRYGEERLPVSNVSYADATKYAAWVGGRLPTADEWEVAGHLGTRQPFPWGTELPRPLRSAQGVLLPVSSEPLDLSKSGCFDLAASVSEWVSLPQGIAAYRGGHHLSRVDFFRLTRVPFVIRGGQPRMNVGFRVVNRGKN